MSVGVSIGSAQPSGTGISIAALPNAAADGDFVLMAYTWGVGFATRQLSSVSDTNGNTWNLVPFGSANESGGFAYCFVGTGKGWASGANTVTGTLTGGAPGGRTWGGVKIPAANVTSFDQHTSSPNQSSPASVSTGTLLQAAEALFAVAVSRASAGTASFTWSAPFAKILDSVSGGTPASGLSIAEFDNSSGTSPVTATVTTTQSTDANGVGIIAIELATGIVVIAPVATVDSAGILGAPAEIASAPLAGVASVGLAPLAALVLAAPLAVVASVGFPGGFPATSERFRTRFYRPVVETLAAKWEGWWRF